MDLQLLKEQLDWPLRNSQDEAQYGCEQHFKNNTSQESSDQAEASELLENWLKFIFDVRFIEVFLKVCVDHCKQDICRAMYVIVLQENHGLSVTICTGGRILKQGVDALTEGKMHTPCLNCCAPQRGGVPETAATNDSVVTSKE